MYKKVIKKLIGLALTKEFKCADHTLSLNIFDIFRRLISGNMYSDVTRISVRLSAYCS